MPITLNGDTGITTPGLTNTGSTTLVNLTTTGNTILGDQSTDTLNVANGNLVLNSSGNLGIGTASPAYKLDVVGTGLVSSFGSNTVAETYIQVKNGASTLYLGGTSSYNYVYSTASVPLTFWTNSTERMRLDTSGNLGIGTASPASALYVKRTSGNSGIYTDYNGTNVGRIEAASNGNLYIGITTGSGDLSIGNTANATALNLSSSGNLGIGTTGPTTKLDVRGTSASVGSTIQIVGNSVSTLLLGQNADGGVIRGQGGNNALTFWTGGFADTAASGSGTERARITSAGNVGIGTTSPSSILTLSQAQAPITTFWGSARADGNPYTAGGIESTFVTRDGVPALGAFIRILDVNTFGAFPTTIRGGAITFGTVDGLSGQGVNATERARIDSSGNLLIGATSTRASSKLDIRGDVMTLGSNGTYYGTIDYNAGTGLLSLASESGGGIRFLSGATERVRITSSGVGIGTTSPGNYILNAQSAILFRSAFLSYTPDGLYGATALPSRIDTPGSGQILFGYTDGGGGQYAPRIGFGQTSPNTAAQNSIGNVIDGSLTFNVGASNTERARIDSSGVLLVNRTSYIAGVGSSCKLQVLGGQGEWSLGVTNGGSTQPYGILMGYGAAPNTANWPFFLGADSAATRFSVYSNGGIANYSANDVNLSDRREKKNFAPAKSYLDVICSIPVQTFNYIDQNMEDDDGLTLGVVAQDVLAVAPELVMESNWANKDEEPKIRLSVYQTDLQYALMKCIQELKSELDSVKTELAALKGN